MLDRANITILRVNSVGVGYGAPIEPDELEHVWDAVESEIVEGDQDAGEVTLGGQRYEWLRG